MLVLLTNDDGIFSAGLRAIALSLSQVARVIVIAPERQQSATGHAITLHKPLRMEPVELEGAAEAYASNGTPADCVILGTVSDLPKPDIVVSGINAGANLGEEVLYSGTVSAAMEAALQGLPSIAISVAAYTDVLYDGAAVFARHLVEGLYRERPLAADTFLNVNVPNRPADELLPPKLTRLGRRKYTNVLSRRLDPRGRPYFWFSGAPLASEGGEGTDIAAISMGHISVTPIHFDLTGDLSDARLPRFVEGLKFR